MQVALLVYNAHQDLTGADQKPRETLVVADKGVKVEGWTL